MLKDEITKALEYAADAMACKLHNDGASLIGNTAKTDVLWLARRLYDASTLGACDVSLRDWRITPEEFAELELHPKGVWNEQRFDSLPQEKQSGWIKLARIVLLTIPGICERIGHRMMLQAEVVRAVEKQLRAEG